MAVLLLYTNHHHDVGSSDTGSSGVFHISTFSGLSQNPSCFHSSQRSRRVRASISDGLSPNNSDHLMSNVTCFMFIVVQFAGRRESNPDNSRIALAILLCLRWNRKPCRPVCRSFPAVRAFRVICPMESSVLFRFATAILRRVTPAPSSPYLHSGFHLKKGDCGWLGTRTPVLISKQQPIFPISLFISCRHPISGTP